MHRQISALFLNIFTNLAINLPYLLFVLGIYSRYIIPFPQVSGWTSWLGGILGGIFTILDMNMSNALTKFYAEYRVRSSFQVIKYVQIWVWWQIFTNLAQATVLIALTMSVFPVTNIGYLGYFVVLCSISRLPGIFGVLGYVLDGEQRFAVKIAVNTVLGYLVNNVISYTTILLCRFYFSQLPQYGEAFGAAVGIYVGGYIAGVVDFVVFVFVFRRIGLPVRALFRVDFSWQEFKEMFLFGAKLASGFSVYAFTGILENLLIAGMVFNYQTQLGLLGMVGNLTSVLGPISTFTSAMMPAISEAHSNGKKILTEYYLIEGIKWSYFFVFFFIAVLAAVGPNLIQLAGSQWAGALDFIPIQLFFASFWPLAWFVDTIFQGTNHAGYNTGVWYVEQGTRILLLILLLTPLQIWGRYWSYIPAIIAKNIVALYLIRKKILAFRLYWVHMLLAPAAGAVIIYGILWGIQSLVVDAVPILGIFVFIGGFLGGLILYAGITGFFGGWDDHTLDEFQHGIGMVRLTRAFFRPMQKAARWGHTHSPWRNRFQVDIAQQAQVEAQALTTMRQG